MTGKKDMMIIKFGEHYVSVRISDNQPQDGEQIILFNGSSIYGEYIDGIFIVQSYDLDLSEDPDLINKIAKELSLTTYSRISNGELTAHILKPAKRN